MSVRTFDPLILAVMALVAANGSTAFAEPISVSSKGGWE